jgi:drug/metabolite transporter (DMT)-like permease
MTRRHLAIQLMIAQAILFAAETAAIHQIGGRMSVMQLALLRAAGGIVLAVALAGGSGFALFRTEQVGLQLLRGAVSLLYLWVMMYSFAHMTFADATAISYTQSAYIVAFSALILAETVTGGQWAAAAIGILGALLIAKPGFTDWNFAYLVALVGTSLNGLAFVLNRYLQRQDSEATTMFYSNLVPLLGNAPALAWTAVPAPEILAWLPWLFVFGPVGMYVGIVAVRHADAAVLGPYTLLRLVIAVVAGAIVFRELPDFLGVFGIILILAGCLLSSSRRLVGFRVGLRDLYRWIRALALIQHLVFPPLDWRHTRSSPKA